MPRQDMQRELDRIRKLPWTAQFVKTVTNDSVPGGKIDMYILLDDDTGETMITMGVPHGHGLLAEYVAGCCSDPYFVRTRDVHDTAIAGALNRALKSFFGPDGHIDRQEVHAAAITLIEAYVGQMPKRSRQELIDNTIGILSRIRNGE